MRIRYKYRSNQQFYRPIIEKYRPKQRIYRPIGKKYRPKYGFTGRLQNKS
ncbi:hypothetical protein J7I91_18610 [Pseudomonas sp. ISL-84]|nr:hypothetical protein [Pseudomonas sp. ISL-84]